MHMAVHCSKNLSKYRSAAGGRRVSQFYAHNMPSYKYNIQPYGFSGTVRSTWWSDLPAAHIIIDYNQVRMV